MKKLKHKLQINNGNELFSSSQLGPIIQNTPEKTVRLGSRCSLTARVFNIHQVYIKDSKLIEKIQTLSSNVSDDYLKNLAQNSKKHKAIGLVAFKLSDVVKAFFPSKIKIKEEKLHNNGKTYLNGLLLASHIKHTLEHLS